MKGKTQLLLAMLLTLAAAGCPSDETVTRTVIMPAMVQIRTPHLPDTVVGASSLQTLDVGGGSGTYDFTIESGGLNHGWLTLDPTTGDLTGTPLTAADVSFTVRAADVDDATNYDLAYYSFMVLAPTYPGSPVSENNHAPDGQAFSPTGMEPYIGAGAAPVLMFQNNATGTGIAIIKMMDDQTNDGEGDPEDRYALWASYFDGNALTPMVEIHATFVDLSDNFWVHNAKVIFLNSVTDRDGDAVIVFTMRESDPDTGESSDVRLYSSYFDVSDYQNAVSASDPDVRHGFDTTAVLVNNDIDNFGVDGVIAFSDGFWIESVMWSGHFMNGNAVTTVGVVWTEKGTGISPAPDGVMYSADFDLTSANTDNSFSSPVQVTPATAMDDSDEFDPVICFTGKTIFYRVLKNAEAAALDHRILEAAAWNATTGSFENAARLTRTDINSTVEATLPSAAFGAIQGLAKAYALGHEGGYDVAGVNPDWDMMLYIYDPSDGSFDVQELDAHSANVPAADTINFKAVLNRTAEIIWVSWIQRHSDLNDTNCLFMQAIQTIPSGGTDRLLANSILASPEIMNSTQTSANPYFAQILAFAAPHGYIEEETVTDGTASGQVMTWIPPTPATQIFVTNIGGVPFPGGTVVVGQTSAYSDTTIGVSAQFGPYNNAHVSDFAFPKSLEYGLSLTSNHLHADVLFLQLADSATDYDNLSLRTAYLEATLDTTGSNPPTATAGSGSITDTLIWTNDQHHTFWDPASLDMKNFRICESGTTGEPIVFFMADGDGTPQHEITTEAREARLFVWDARAASPTATEISGDGTDTGVSTFGFSNSRQVTEFNVLGVPCSLYTGSGTETASPTHLHVSFSEERDVPGSTSAMRHRCFDLGSASATIQGQFFPGLTVQPFTVDCDVPGDATPYAIGGAPNINGTTFAVYFQHGAHIWFNEYTPGAGETWYLQDGVSAPCLVDDEGHEQALWYAPIPTFTPTDLDFIGKSPVFYLKLTDFISFNTVRLFVRVHD
jgi:hypothetical protein